MRFPVRRGRGGGLRRGVSAGPFMAPCLAIPRPRSTGSGCFPEACDPEGKDAAVGSVTATSAPNRIGWEPTLPMRWSPGAARS
jgi:hypothetical protein